jgi:hypothetical protein
MEAVHSGWLRSATRASALAALLAAAGCYGSIGEPGVPAGGGSGGDTMMPPGEPLCTALPAVPRRVWRLSVGQYSNSVRDLLGLDAGPTLDSTGGTSLYAFFSDDTATVDAQLAFQVNTAVRQLMTDQAARIPALAGCMTGETEDACATRFAQQFGLRAFRRPMVDAEVTALKTVYTEGRKQDFNTGISLMIQALLQSPSFMFRSELGSAAGDTTLTGYEIASQLSYTFLDSMPDAALFDAAAKGTLANQQGIAAQVDRLLGLPAVKANITRIVLGWFNTQQLYAKTKDPALLAALGAGASDQTGIQNDLYDGAQAFVNDVLWNGSGKVADLLDSQKLFVNQRLATLYGLPFSGSDPSAFVGVDSPVGGRAGLLTQPAVIWAASDAAVTSIVKRGKFIHDDVICADPVPAPGAILDDPDVKAKLAMLPTEIDKSNYRLSTAQCAQCHSSLDPYGLTLEGIDPVGNARTLADGIPVQNTGDFSMDAPLTGMITGPTAFAQAIISDKQLMGCAAQKVASYVIGRMIRVNATCEVRQARDAVDKGDGTMTAIFRQIAGAAFTRARSGGAQ